MGTVTRELNIEGLWGPAPGFSSGFRSDVTGSKRNYLHRVSEDEGILSHSAVPNKSLHSSAFILIFLS